MLIFILLLCLITPAYGLETISSPDGKWQALKPFYQDLNPTIGLESSEDKVHTFHMFLYIQDKLVMEEITKSNNYRKMLDYKKPNTIRPNFAFIKCLIYVDSQAIAAYEFYTNGTGMVTFALFRWMY